ncbi:MAG: glutamate synthase [Candidatus Riflebacteria bacterium]|nr:glutamate synthase [Candidatus Riflebacteria bacterium]
MNPPPSRHEANAIIRSRLELVSGIELPHRRTLEGGCGVIGIIGSRPLGGRFITRACAQMRNRGNGKGGGVAAVGLFPDRADLYALHLALLDDTVRAEVEREFVEPVFTVAHAERQESLDDHRDVGLEVRPPAVWRYFVRVRPEIVDRFATSHGIESERAAEDECVYRNSFKLNHRYYASGDRPRAFVLSHGRDLLVLKGVGFAEEIARFYRLEERKAHLWIGHQRYPTRGRVWHPGGAHPFVGLHEALVHNGDFANYHAVTEYLRQRGIVPLFVTDTEVSVLLFDLYSRVLGYPLELVVEALAPTPEGDFERLSKRRQRIYRALQTAHIHGSPDGPWFFIVARADPATGSPQLIGITDVSMLRPQVFAFQGGSTQIGAIASEKQAIDAFFEDVAADHPEVSPVADRYWNARGGSCTDGGAFVYSLARSNDAWSLDVRDKFGNLVVGQPVRSMPAAGEPPTRELRRACEVGPGRLAELLDRRPVAPSDGGPGGGGGGPDERIEGPPGPNDPARASRNPPVTPGLAAQERLEELLVQGAFADFAAEVDLQLGLPPSSSPDPGSSFAGDTPVEPDRWQSTLGRLTFLRDRHRDPGPHRRATLLSWIDRAIQRTLDRLPGPDRRDGSAVVRLDRETVVAHGVPSPGADGLLVIDARGFPPEGRDAVSRTIVAAHRLGWRRFVIYRCRGDRFLGCGLGPGTADVRIDVYGSSGDYLGSGMDGAHVYVHGDAQDQVGQILNTGRIVVF